MDNQVNNCSIIGKQKVNINNLNDDILRRIFDFLHLDDKIRLKRVCLRWKLLLNEQLIKLKALRIGKFNSCGYNIISGLNIKCLEHNNNNNNNNRINYHLNYNNNNNQDKLSSRNKIFLNINKFPEATLFNDKILILPADCVSQCFSINHYDYLHRSLKHCYKTLTILSLGHINISYRFLIVIANNLPNLEHLELIACCSRNEIEFEDDHDDDNSKRKNREILKQLPSLESFNNQQSSTINLNQFDQDLYSNLIFNQNNNEEINIRDRLRRAQLIKNCQLIRDSRLNNYWPKLKHLLLKDCNQLNEFSLSLIVSLTSKTLEQLFIESNQYLTGEFLNFCGLNLKLLRIKYCPLMQIKFLKELIDIKQFFSNNQQNPPKQQQNKYSIYNNYNQQQQDSFPQPISPSMFKNFANFKQDIYCSL